MPVTDVGRSMIELTAQDEAVLEKELEDFRVEHSKAELTPIWKATGFRKHAIPPTISAFSDELDALRIALDNASRRDAVLVLDENFAALIKLILFTQRRTV